MNGGDTVFVRCRLCLFVCVCVSVCSGPVNQTSLKRLKQRTSNLTRMFPGTVRTWALNFFFKKGDVCKNLLGGDMHSHERLLTSSIVFHKNHDLKPKVAAYVCFCVLFSSVMCHMWWWRCWRKCYRMLMFTLRESFCCLFRPSAWSQAVITSRRSAPISTTDALRPVSTTAALRCALR